MQYSAMTDMGLVRQMNQDYYIAINNPIGTFRNLFLIADGVGSNIKSGYASKHTCDFVYDQIKKTIPGIDYVEEFSKIFRMANTDLFYRILANKDYNGMGTTLIMSTIDNDRLIVGNVGDSRCYHIRDKIVQVTRDHSVAEELVRTNSLKRDSDIYQQYKHQLTKAIGAQKTIVPDFFEIELEIGDYILFCTDGITNMLTDQNIFGVVVDDFTLDEKVNILKTAANNNGGLDNMAVILIYIDYIDKNVSIFEQEKRMANDKKLYEIVKEKEEEKEKQQEFLKSINISDLMIDLNNIDENDDIKIYNMRGRSRKRVFDNNKEKSEIKNIRKEEENNE